MKPNCRGATASLLWSWLGCSVEGMYEHGSHIDPHDHGPERPAHLYEEWARSEHIHDDSSQLGIDDSIIHGRIGVDAHVSGEGPPQIIHGSPRRFPMQAPPPTQDILPPQWLPQDPAKSDIEISFAWTQHLPGPGMVALQILATTVMMWWGWGFLKDWFAHEDDEDEQERPDDPMNELRKMCTSIDAQYSNLPEGACAVNMDATSAATTTSQSNSSAFAQVSSPTTTTYDRASNSDRSSGPKDDLRHSIGDSISSEAKVHGGDRESSTPITESRQPQPGRDDGDSVSSEMKADVGVRESPTPITESFVTAAGTRRSILISNFSKDRPFNPKEELRKLIPEISPPASKSEVADEQASFRRRELEHIPDRPSTWKGARGELRDLLGGVTPLETQGEDKKIAGENSKPRHSSGKTGGPAPPSRSGQRGNARSARAQVDPSDPREQLRKLLED